MAIMFLACYMPRLQEYREKEFYRLFSASLQGYDVGVTATPEDCGSAVDGHSLWKQMLKEHMQ